MEIENAKRETDPNPPYGGKGGFRKITITLPLDAYEGLMAESVRRKTVGEPNQLLSALLREAASRYFDGGALEEIDAGTEWTRDSAIPNRRGSGVQRQPAPQDEDEMVVPVGRADEVLQR